MIPIELFFRFWKYDFKKQEGRINIMKKQQIKGISALCAIGLMTLAPNGHAQSVHLEKRLGLGAGVGLAIPVAPSSFSDPVDTGYSLEGHADYYLSDAWGVEAAYNRYHYDSGAPTTNSYGLGVIYRFLPNAKLTPVAGIGAGYATTSGTNLSSLDYDGFTLNAKLGLDYSICENWIVSATAKWAWLDGNGDATHDEHGFMPQVNFTYFFGAHASSNVAMTSNEKADGDDDHDGVANSIDQCANTPKNAKVNSLGCPVDQKVDFTINIQFDASKATVKPQYQGELAKMAKLLKAHSDMKAEIEGFTDSSGKKESNIQLSAARAKAVVTYLVKKLGVPAKQLTSKGYGPENPIADNATAEGRAKNRRVVASLSSVH